MKSCSFYWVWSCFDSQEDHTRILDEWKWDQVGSNNRWSTFWFLIRSMPREFIT